MDQMKEKMELLPKIRINALVLVDSFDFLDSNLCNHLTKFIIKLFFLSIFYFFQVAHWELMMVEHMRDYLILQENLNLMKKKFTMYLKSI